MQPTFAARFSTCVVENPVPTTEDAIGNQLLKTWVLLSRRTIHEGVILGI